MPVIRSLLFVPGDRERMVEKALGSAADALILDLEDAVLPDRKASAREVCRAALAAGPAGPKLFVRINALGTPHLAADLAAVVGGGPFGIVLPKCQSARDLMRLGDMLDVMEVREGVSPGSTALLPIVTETAASMLNFGSYAEASLPRLFGMTWGGEDLAADVGARTNRDEAGGYAHPYQLARTMCLFAAAAAEAAPVDAVFTDLRDEKGLEQEAAAAAKAGFTAKMAIHPAQVPVINAAFSPTAAELETARRVVDAFAAVDGTGVAVLDNRMLDRPHHRAALRVLAAAR